MKFTTNYIESLKPTGKMEDIREANGFGIRVLPSGVKTWFFIYRIDGKRRFMNLGHYPSVSLADARKRYRAAYDLYEQGKDPLRLAEEAKEERRKAPTVAELVKEYLEKHAASKRSGAAMERLLRVEVVPLWGKRKAEDIKKRDIILLLESIIERGTPAMSNQVLKITRHMFNFAVERDILQTTPFIGVKPLAANVKRNRVLTEAEIKTLWARLDDADMSNDVRRGIKLVLLTGQRPGEVTGMHTSEIDGAWWTIPTERAKNGLAHRVPLTALALEIIQDALVEVKRSRKLSADEEYSGYVFPCPHRSKEKSIERHALSKAVARNLETAITDNNGEPVTAPDGKPLTENKLGIDKFTPHDLRRTAATFLAQLGQMDEVIDSVLNHKKVGIISTYNLYRYDYEKQIALEVWERKLNSILSGQQNAKIIPLQRRATAG